MAAKEQMTPLRNTIRITFKSALILPVDFFFETQDFYYKFVQNNVVFLGDSGVVTTCKLALGDDDDL